MKIVKKSASTCWAILMLATMTVGQQRRPIQPADCVTVRYLSDDALHRPIAINPQGTRIAYLVKSPNLTTNQNDIELYVGDLSRDASSVPRPILRGSPISSMQWLTDGRHLTILYKHAGRTSIEKVDVETGSHETLLKMDTDVAEYSISAAGDVIVFAIEGSGQTAEPTIQASASGHTPDETAAGFRIPAEPDSATPFPKRKLFLSHSLTGRWTSPKPITIRSPFTHEPIMEIPYPFEIGLRLSLAPNGKKILVTYASPATNLPEPWAKDPYVRVMSGAGYPGIIVSVLYDIDTGETSLPLESPSVLSIPFWSEDSSSFVVVAQPPVRHEPGLDEDPRKPDKGGGPHLYSVELNTRKVEQIAPHVTNIVEQPLFWTEDKSLLVRTSADTISKFGHDQGEWNLKSNIKLPDGWSYRNASLASNETYVVGDFQNAATPPEIIAYLPKQNNVRVLARLNPQFDGLTLAPADKVHWKNSEGLEVDGLLFTPPSYVRTQRYPLIIQTHPYTGGFACDSGQDHFPSYIPQLAANAGILYLVQTYPEDWNETNWEAHYPQGYPGEKGYGGLQEAASSMDVWDSAVKTFNERGLIDPTRVGIEGFSRKGWYVEFILAHAKTHYRAATATDNVQYSVGEYWLRHSAAQMKAYDLLYGGPPYGSSLKNWMDYSVSFNLNRFHTPLLMERMGYGDTSYREYASLSLTESYEVFTGLVRMRKPVEFYYYPNEKHQPDHPKARLATLQRNLDWYRFWLQGYERPDGNDPSQYERWHGLRELQFQDYPQDGVRADQTDSPRSIEKQNDPLNL